MSDGKTLFDKIWDSHVIATLGSGLALMHIDRTFIHDLSGDRSLGEMERLGLKVRNPELCFATPDHAISSEPGRDDASTEISARVMPVFREKCRTQGITLFDIKDDQQGIVHVIGPELGLTLPGVTLVCGDSHTCTHGGLGSLAWGIGSSELNHVLTTQSFIGEKPKTLRVRFEGKLQEDVSAKDMILYLISQHGADAGNGYAVEYAGSTIRNLSVEERMTICNLSIEMGAKMGQVAPDDTTYDYLFDRRYAPKGELWEKALAYWKTLSSDESAGFDKEIEIEVSHITPQISWGTSPAHTVGVTDSIPDPTQTTDLNLKTGWEKALHYMDLKPGQPIEGLPIDRVFIGSCTNSRISDLKVAAQVVAGYRVAPHIEAWVVPGSQQVKREAEQLGLDTVFKEAGFQWREPGCSRCVAANGEYVEAGKRCVSTSNRNFVGRQGPGARTHLAGPAMAACAALTGKITDIRKFRRAS